VAMSEGIGRTVVRAYILVDCARAQAGGPLLGRTYLDRLAKSQDDDDNSWQTTKTARCELLSRIRCEKFIDDRSHCLYDAVLQRHGVSGRELRLSGRAVHPGLC
jgi:hypothetical protein